MICRTIKIKGRYLESDNLQCGAIGDGVRVWDGQFDDVSATGLVQAIPVIIKRAPNKQAQHQTHLQSQQEIL
jgi:hypothetical protein